jgi:pre-mRNA-processing factor 17
VSYDKTGKVWDTETGACTVNLAPGCIPYCGTWHPEDPATALLGCANRKIMQYDVRTGECVLEYNYHLGPVNAVLFVDDNRRIVSTSDDKKVREAAGEIRGGRCG